MFRIIYPDTILPLQLYWEIVNKHNVQKENEEKQIELVVNNIVIYSFLNMILIYIAVRKIMFFMTI